MLPKIELSNFAGDQAFTKLFSEKKMKKLEKISEIKKFANKNFLRNFFIFIKSFFLRMKNIFFKARKFYFMKFI